MCQYSAETTRFLECIEYFGKKCSVLILELQDRDLMATLISNELKRIRDEKPGIGSQELEAHMNTFTSGLWTSFRALNALNIYENVAHNKRASADPDHWFENSLPFLTHFT